MQRVYGRMAVLLVVSLLASGCSRSGAHAGAAVSSASVPAAGPAGSEPSGARGAPQVGMQDAERVTAALLGARADPQDFIAGVTPADAQLPPGSGLTLDAAKASVEGDTARVPAVATGPLAGAWMVLLVRESGLWRVYGTTRP